MVRVKCVPMGRFVVCAGRIVCVVWGMGIVSFLKKMMMT